MSNPGFWDTKLARNVERDRGAQDALRAAGWAVEVIWECKPGGGYRAGPVAPQRRATGPSDLTRQPAKKLASLGGTALPIIRTTSSI